MRNLRLLAITTTLVLAACAESDTELFELDEEAAAEVEDGKADGANGLVRLERATSAEVAASMKIVRGAELTACFASYREAFDPSATKLTKAVAGQFIQVAIRTFQLKCAEWMDLRHIVISVLDAKGLVEATPAQVIEAIPAWAKPQLDAASVGGFVQFANLASPLYKDLSRVHEANARKREKNPTGVRLTVVRAAWDEVRDGVSLGTNFDHEYLNPVTFAPGALEGTKLFKSLRAAFPLKRLALESTGNTAIREFATAYEGPDGDPAFDPIATALRNKSIKKRFYFLGGGEDWASNVLIVIDEHGQAFGMQMGVTN